MREREKNQQMLLFSPPVLLWEKGGGGIFQKAPFGNLLLAERGKKFPPSPSQKPPAELLKNSVSVDFLLEKYGKMATPFSPRFFPVMMFTQLRRMLQPEKKTSFSHAKRAKVDDPQFPPNPEEKCVTNFERQKPMCSLPSLESDRAPKKNRCAHFLLRSPQFPPLSTKEIVKREGGEEGGKKQAQGWTRAFFWFRADKRRISQVWVERAWL